MLENPEYSLCGTFFSQVNTEGLEYNKVELPESDEDIRIELLSASGMPVCCGSVLARSECVHKVGGYRSYFHDCSGEDDTEAPSDFFVTQGAVTARTIELLLNGNDDLIFLIAWVQIY